MTSNNNEFGSEVDKKTLQTKEVHVFNASIGH